MAVRYTLVQHSDWGHRQKRESFHAVELRALASEREVALVERAGGLLFSSYADADAAEMRENYPDGQGLTPRVRGAFHPRIRIDGLAVYLPKTGPAGT